MKKTYITIFDMDTRISQILDTFDLFEVCAGFWMGSAPDYTQFIEHCRALYDETCTTGHAHHTQRNEMVIAFHAA